MCLVVRLKSHTSLQKTESKITEKKLKCTKYLYSGLITNKWVKLHETLQIKDQLNSTFIPSVIKVAFWNQVFQTHGKNHSF